MDTYPEQIGPFRLRHEMGRSTLYIDYRAEDMRTGQDVMLKLPGDSFPRRPARLTQFVSAGQRAERLDHPNIVPVVTAGEEDGVHYIASAYVVGERLTDLLANRETPLDPDRTLEIVADVASALDYAHEAGVVHNGLTTDNVIITDDGTVFITDFCLAEGQDVAAANVAESPPAFETFFLAPEQLRSDLDADQRADVFGVGVVTYAMLTRRLPFEATSQGALIHAIINDPPFPAQKANPGLPAGMAYVLGNVLAKGPEVRYGDAGEFHDALVAGLAWNPVAGAATAATNAGASRGRQLGGILVTLVGLTAIVSVAFFVLRPAIEPPGSGEADQGVTMVDATPTEDATLVDAGEAGGEETPTVAAVAAASTSDAEEADATDAPTMTPTDAPPNTPTNTPTDTPTTAPTETETPSATATPEGGTEADGADTAPTNISSGDGESKTTEVSELSAAPPEGTADKDAVALPTLTHTPEPTSTSTSTNTPRPTATSTNTPRPTATATNTPRPTSTATNTPRPTATATNTARQAATSTNTPRPTATSTNTPRPTATSTNTPRPTPTSTNTPRPTPTSTNTPRPTATSTNTPRPTATSTNTPRPTATSTNTPRPTATSTNTPRPTPTSTNTPRPTSTATNTPRPTATATNTARPTATATNTPRPTATATNTPRPTSTSTNTPRPTATATNTLVPTLVPTDTPIPTATFTNTPNPTATPTNTLAPTVTNTPVPPPTNTPLPLPTSTSTNTPTVTPIPSGAGAVQLLLPVDGSAANDSQIFQWNANVQPGEGQAFELVFWRPDQSPLGSGFGLAAPTTNSEIVVSLAALDSALGDLLEPGEYLWGLLLVQTDPYQRIQFMGAQHNFRFYREGDSGSSGGPPSSGE